MNKPTLYRKRFIPNEIIHLKDDEITYMDDEVIVTKWDTLKPRKDFTNGSSCYFLKKGFKVSNIYNRGELVYIYCDIIEVEFDESKNEYIFFDLLVDVIIYPNGFVKVVDLAEIAEGIDKSLITIEQAKKALILTDKLLEIIHSENLEKLTKYL